jgi:hypothetical protein
VHVALLLVCTVLLAALPPPSEHEHRLPRAPLH